MVKKVLYFNEFGGKIYDIYSTDLFLTTKYHVINRA